MARFCTNCGARLEDGDRFCTSCGAPVYQDPEEGAGAGRATVVAGAPVPAGDAGPVAPGIDVPDGAPIDGAEVTQRFSAQVPPVSDGGFDQGIPAAGTKRRSRAPFVVGGAVAGVAVVAIAVVLFTVGPLAPKSADPAAAAAGSVDTGSSGASVSKEKEPKEADDADSKQEEDSPAASDSDSGSKDASDSTEGQNGASVSVQGQTPGDTGASESQGNQGSTGSSASSAASSSEYILPDSQTRVYSTDELSQLSDEQLLLARNEIYARHGRGFKDSFIRGYFESKSWYHQQYTAEQFDAMPSPLSSTEQANVAAIQKVENSRK